MTSTARITTIILTYRRDDALKRTLDRLKPHISGRDDHELIIVDNNADGIDRSSILAGLNGQYIALPRNLGVTGGRNAGIRAATGEVLVFLDDDALVEGGLHFMDSILARFDADPRLGAVAFRSWLRRSEIYDPAEFPHTDKSRPKTFPFETFRFIGVGHALRRAALARVGLYPESFFYGMEEFDMSYRLMKAGYRIRFDPAFTVTHMKAEDGRLVKKDVIERMYANKLFIAWRHLPAKEAVLCALAWAVKTVTDSRDPMSAVRGFVAFTKNVKAEEASREPSGDLVNQIRQLGGVAWK